MRLKIDDKSEAQGFEESRLPHFSDEDSAMILGSSDFLGINFYTANYAYPETSDLGDVSWSADMDVGSYQDETWYAAGSSWLKVTPWGIRSAIRWASQRYNHPDIYVTENGVSTKLRNLDDLHRVYYLKHYINQVLKSVVLDGVNVLGYFAWSLVDVFEWTAGYTENFGLHRVNMSDPERARTPKLSASYYSGIVKENGFVEGGC